MSPRPSRRGQQGILPGGPAVPEGLDAGWEFERRAWDDGRRAVAGLDEVGRGALAGPVVVAAVIFPVGTKLLGLRDSKLLSPARREELASEIRGKAAGFVVEHVGPEVVDQVNVLEATLLASSRAVAGIQPRPDLLLLDALKLPGTELPQRSLIGGDRLSATIAAASILAKVDRDRLMVEFDRSYPYYGFGRHKGYGTREHLDALRSRGPCPIHRRTFLRREAGGVPPRSSEGTFSSTPAEEREELGRSDLSNSDTPEEQTPALRVPPRTIPPDLSRLARG